jgi:hypothetical protein
VYTDNGVHFVGLKKKKIKRIKKTDNTDNGVSVNNVYEVYLSYQVQCGNLRVIVV